MGIQSFLVQHVLVAVAALLLGSGCAVHVYNSPDMQDGRSRTQTARTISVTRDTTINNYENYHYEKNVRRPTETHHQHQYRDSPERRPYQNSSAQNDFRKKKRDRKKKERVGMNDGRARKETFREKDRSRFKDKIRNKMAQSSTQDRDKVRTDRTKKERDANRQKNRHRVGKADSSEKNGRSRSKPCGADFKGKVKEKGTKISRRPPEKPCDKEFTHESPTRVASNKK
ncbi:MAG: hypothetical protein JXR76_23560 [Deltaproteobacteria bacterium]|nr:hypothetical protein [Deltaproteobacteria bacterium]